MLTGKESVAIMRVLNGLREVYTPEGCGIWLFAKQGQWGDRSAVELLTEGRISEPLHAVEAMRAGNAT